jgi:hypothetical protein
MKTTLLAALLAVIGLAGCEKTTVNPPTTVVTPAPTTSTAPAPTTVVEKETVVPVPGPAGEKGEKGEPGAPGEKGEPGDTTIVVPERR